jgi:hypothetical protein
LLPLLWLEPAKFIYKIKEEKDGILTITNYNPLIKNKNKNKNHNPSTLLVILFFYFWKIMHFMKNKF